MELKDKLVSSFMAFENNVDVENPVHDIRTEAIKNFETKGFPTKKEEAWKYTSLNSLRKIDFSIFSKKENNLEYKDVNGVDIKEVQYNNFNMNTINYGISTYLGYRSTSLYVKYDLNPLFKNTQTRNFSLGIRLDFD